MTAPALGGVDPMLFSVKPFCVWLCVLEKRIVDTSSEGSLKRCAQLGAIGPIGLRSDLGDHSSVLIGLCSEIYDLAK